MRLRPCHKRTAFSLIELIAAVTVISLLSALVFPFLRKARQQADQAKCSTHMRGYLGAMQLYAADNGGYLPTSTYRDPDNSDNKTNVVEVRVTLAPYTFGYSSSLPSWQIFSLTSSTMCTAAGWVYGFNSFVSKMPVAEIVAPEKTAYIIDQKSRWINATTLSSASGMGDLRTAAPKPHQGKINVGFMDGRVESWYVSDLTHAHFTRGTPSYRETHDSLHFATKEYDK